MEENNLSLATTSATAQAVRTAQQTTTETTAAVDGHVGKEREVHSGSSQRTQEVRGVKPGVQLFTDAAYKTTTTSSATGSSVVQHQSNLGERYATSDIAAAPYVVVQEESKQQLNVDATTSHEAAVQHAADDAATQPQAHLNGTTVRLVPEVLDRLFSYVSLSDNVICLLVHWLLRSLACPQLHSRLTAPKGNGFLLKWPLCFGDRQDIYPVHRQFRYIDLLRYNVSLQVPPAEVIKQVQVFLAGYESMLLGEVHASAVNSRYNNLNTFIVDFSCGYRDNDRCIDKQRALWTRKSEYIMPRPDDELAAAQRHAACNQRERCSKCVAKNELFSGSWQRWAETITTVTNSCNSTLTHFVFTMDSEFSGEIPSLGECRLRLPDELYRALNFDRMLSEMPHLRTLHFPIRDYELAFVVVGSGEGRGCEFDKAARQKAWPLLRRMPANEILPQLQRIVVQSVEHMISRPVRDYEPVCGMPDLPRETEIMVESYKDDRHAENRRNHIVFPSATTSIAPYNKSELYICLRALGYWYCNMYAAYKLNETDAKQLAVAIAAHVNDEASIRQQQRLSVLNSVRSVAAATKAILVVPVGDWIYMYLDAPIEFEKNLVETISTLVHLMQTHRMCPPSAVRIRFEEESFQPALGGQRTSSWNWDCARPLLPFFAVGNNYNVDEAILGTMRIDMVLHNFTTFGAKVGEWSAEAQELNDGSESLFGQKYRIPGINLSVYNKVRVSAGNVTAEVCVKAIERQVLKKIRAFLRDAVESGARRDLSFYLYQSLKRVAYVFWSEVKGDANKQFKERAGLLLNARAAKFEQRLMREVFADVWKDDEFGCSSSLLAVADEGCGVKLTSVMKLSALRSISSNIHIRIV